MSERRLDGNLGRTRFAAVLVRLTVLAALLGAVVPLLRSATEAGNDRGGALAASDTVAGPRQVRPPTVAGQFYPGDPAELRSDVARRLKAAPSLGLKNVRAVLVPHAGYAFSADVAAASFREVSPGFRRVFVLAANHNGKADFSGVSIPNVTHYAIPGAEVPLSSVVTRLRQDKLFTTVPAAHTMHMIEAELPFLESLHGWPSMADFAIVPMIAGRMDEKAIDRLATILASYADDRTLFVFSVDLSHYYPDSTARRLDSYTIDSVMSMDREAIAQARADGDQVLETMVALARRRGWEPTFLMSRNSGDVNGDKTRVVGYGAIAFHDPLVFTKDDRQALLAFARSAIATHLGHGRAPEPEAAWLNRHPIFRIRRGAFVTLEKQGRLRGCIGSLLPRQPLYLAIRKNAINAAVHDTRFRPVTTKEFPELSLSISILGYPARVKVDRPEDYLKVLRPHRDGVILVYNGRRSTYLPQVWDDLPDPEQFLSRLSLKQGAPADAWRSPSTALYRYGATVFKADAILQPHRERRHSSDHGR